MQPPFSNHKHIQVVSTFSDLIDLQLQGDTNAVCWSRQLHGDFQEIVNQLELIENITEITVEDLQALQLSEQGIVAREVIIKDIERLTECGASPSLNLLKSYERDDEFDFISTDVYSYHVDRSPLATDTFLCTYYGAASDILPNEQAIQKILIPEIRAKLKELFDGPEAEFENFLAEYFFDLHYQAPEDATPINLGVGHLWRLAVDHPTQAVLPCVHRAPSEAGEYRLLLIC
ncbi:DUF1826 domain-containing protein [Acinetobacter sp.]|uniref:DUF1826 domain-containing protein n=1 Tax=Acinetobacter sp. TaxID=472 RepID=UPI0028966D23|nr:DUF1826 domain-containing protein [Acinetobacter sp.]